MNGRHPGAPKIRKVDIMDRQTRRLALTGQLTVPLAEVDATDQLHCVKAAIAILLEWLGYLSFNDTKYDTPPELPCGRSIPTAWLKLWPPGPPASRALYLDGSLKWWQWQAGDEACELDDNDLLGLLEAGPDLWRYLIHAIESLLTIAWEGLTADVEALRRDIDRVQAPILVTQPTSAAVKEAKDATD